MTTQNNTFKWNCMVLVQKKKSELVKSISKSLVVNLGYSNTSNDDYVLLMVLQEKCRLMKSY